MWCGIHDGGEDWDRISESPEEVAERQRVADEESAKALAEWLASPAGILSAQNDRIIGSADCIIRGYTNGKFCIINPNNGDVMQNAAISAVIAAELELKYSKKFVETGFNACFDKLGYVNSSTGENVLINV
jgi:hypothetical protein